MYFPYLRGRQYELIALRELVEKNLLNAHVLPIVEPVHLSPSLVKTMESWAARKKQIAVIVNPQVGNFSDEIAKKNDSIKANDYYGKYQNLLLSPDVVHAVILNTEHNSLLDEMNNEAQANSLMVILNDKDSIKRYVEEFEKISRFVLMADERAYRRGIHKNRILLDDKFSRQQRNADYLDCEDESFSDDHLYYKEDGYVGFSDYSIIGNEYMESGFAPYAVAIHIVYFDENKGLRVKHFVSESNDDYNNPGLKFYEALTKMSEWVNNCYSSSMMTFGLEQLLHHYQKETYPGLGTVKKLSLMHHMELMAQYLAQGE